MLIRNNIYNEDLRKLDHYLHEDIGTENFSSQRLLFCDEVSTNGNNVIYMTI